MIRIPMLCCLIVCCCASEDVADRLLAAVDRPVGLVHMPLGDVDLALAIAKRQPRCRVHIQLPANEAVIAARMQVYESGLLNRRIFIDQGDMTRLQPVGRSCDLVILPDDISVDEALAAEIQRVLHPWYGVAVLPDAKAAKRIGRHEERDGLHLAIAASMAGSDDWAQWWHSADNNCVSSDTAFSLPATIQWTGKPFFGSTRIELPIVSQGRLFSLWNGSEMDMGKGRPVFVNSPEGDGPILMAQATGSGVRLWMRRLSPAVWMQAARSSMVADGQRLFVADGSELLVLAAASGRELQRIAIDTEEIKWLALHEGRLFVLGGAKTEGKGNRSNANLPAFRGSGELVVSFDSTTLEQLWQRSWQPGEQRFDPRSPAISGERLYICRADDGVEAWNIANGSTIWSVKAGFERGSDAKGYFWDSTSRHPVSGYAMQGVYVISGAEMTEAVILAQDDGRRLWTTVTKGRGQFCPLGFNGLLWAGKKSIDPLSGEPLGKLAINGLAIDRQGKGRDFDLGENVDTSAVAEESATVLTKVFMMTEPTTYTIEGLQAGADYVLRLYGFEAWENKAGQRLCDVSVNDETVLEEFDFFTEAGGKLRVASRDLSAKADADGSLRVRMSATVDSPQESPVLSGIEVRQTGRSLALVPAGGKYGPVAGFKPYDGDSCARSTMAPFMAKTAYDNPESLKSSCSAGSFVANGLLWKFPSPCTGCFEWRGFLQQASAEIHLPLAPPRLQRDAESAVAKGMPQGWLTYRADSSRSSSLDVTVPATAALAWERPAPLQNAALGKGVLMDAEFVPLAPLVADDQVIVAHSDGSIEAMSLNDGSLRWRAHTAGRIQSAPAIWRDRVFVGSCDGHLYAFAMADGRELWRLRVAPEVGRMMVYEQLGSRWPVTAAPIVFGDTVAVSAGMIGSIDGVHMVCADAASGKILWERGDWSETENGGLISGGAQFAAADQLFYHGGQAPPLRIVPGDGKARPAFASGAITLSQGWPGKWRTIQAFNVLWNNVKGQDAGALSKRWLIYGGRRIWSDQREDATWRFTCKIIARDTSGAGQLPVIDVVGSARLPAWDDEGVLFSGAGIGGNARKEGLVMIPRQRFEAKLEELMAGTNTADILALDKKKPVKAQTVPPEMMSKAFNPCEEGLATWAYEFPHGQKAMGWLLSADAVLLACSSEDKLIALNRNDGSLRWEMALPARPVYDGLAVAADGSVLLNLLDGRTLCVAVP